MKLDHILRTTNLVGTGNPEERGIGGHEKISGTENVGTNNIRDRILEERECSGPNIVRMGPHSSENGANEAL